MMSMTELFYGDNEPTWVIGNASHPVRAYMQQPARDYDTPYSYTDRQYTANRYMQPARDYEIPTYTDGQYTASRYMQPARDYEIPIYTQGQYTASRYKQPARDYETAPAYANRQYTASRYMQPARDYEFPNYDEDRHYTTSRYLQPARDYQIPTYTDKHYTSSRYVEPARDYETPTYTGSQYTVSRYMQPSRDHEVRPYTDMHQVSPYDMQYAARHEIPMTHPSENWPRQYSVGSTPSSRNQQVPLSNQTGAARSKNPLPRLELKVPLCCERCEEKVKESLLDMDGVEGVLCDQSHQRVTITGNVQPQKALRRVKKVKKHSDFWTRESRVQQSAGGYSPSKKPSYTESY
jgi:copper chaperone CopZ